MHFVHLFKRSILANSFGECMRANMYVLPTDMHGAFNTLTNEYIGPVPADDTLRTELPNASLAASSTIFTNGSEMGVLAAASPWIKLTCMSEKPLSFRCFFSRAS